MTFEKIKNRRAKTQRFYFNSLLFAYGSYGSFTIFNIAIFMQEILPQKNNPLHGITLERIVSELQAHYGWEKLGERIPIKCFTSNPSIKSSLTFLRKTPWARKKVEDLWIRNFASK